VEEIKHNRILNHLHGSKRESESFQACLSDTQCFINQGVVLLVVMLVVVVTE